MRLRDSSTRRLASSIVGGQYSVRSTRLPLRTLPIKAKEAAFKASSLAKGKLYSGTQQNLPSYVAGATREHRRRVCEVLRSQV